MTVYLVVLAEDQGKVAGIFSTAEKAAEYIAKHPYNSYILLEVVIDTEA